MDNNIVMSQLTMAGVIVWLIQRIKHWAKLQEGADRLFRALGAIGATLSAAGILVAFNWSGAEHTLTMIVSGVTPENVAKFLWVAVQNMFAQETIWRVVKASKDV